MTNQQFYRLLPISAVVAVICRMLLHDQPGWLIVTVCVSTTIAVFLIVHLALKLFSRGRALTSTDFDRRHA